MDDPDDRLLPVLLLVGFLNCWQTRGWRRRGATALRRWRFPKEGKARAKLYRFLRPSLRLGQSRFRSAARATRPPRGKPASQPAPPKVAAPQTLGWNRSTDRRTTKRRDAPARELKKRKPVTFNIFELGWTIWMPFIA